MAEEQEIAAEQTVIDVLYERLDAVRAEAVTRLAQVRKEGPTGSPQNRSERDAFATLYEDRIAQCDAVEDRLCFGRLDRASGENMYVGRIGLSDTSHVPLLTDWRAPAAAAFYAATAAQPGDVVNRRHITTSARTVTAVEDDVLNVEALDDSTGSQLSGEGALLASLGKRRTGRMGDIVATIQAEQDAVIRAPREGALVVQGGPGTGKTAVALHRAAYLMYHHRAQLERSGVLLIGPSPEFLAYIDHVLPSLGETGAVSTTITGLVPGITASGRESDEVALLKGHEQMARVIRAAVRERARLPQEDEHLTIEGRSITIKRSDIADARAKARRDSRSHNRARATFVSAVVSRLADQFVAQLSERIDEDDRRDIERDIRDHPRVRTVLNLCWMPMTPQRLLEDLFDRPELLAHCAPHLSATQRALLHRRRGSALTDADVPLIDEAAELLGEMPGSHPRARGGVSAEEREYARRVISDMGVSGMVNAEDLASRMAASDSRGTVAERASRDRKWTYGHVVVDEAQELSPMAWRMLVRRCPSRSFTIVGDVAQASAAAGTRWWPETMDPLFGEQWTLRELTVSYRIPAEVAQVATSFAVAAKLPASAMTAARSIPESVAITRTQPGDPTGREATLSSHTELTHLFAGGTIAVIVPQDRLEHWRNELPTHVSLVGARDAKGLEFDAVIVAETHLFASASDLFVALTRPTHRLVVIDSDGVPEGVEIPTSYTS